MSVTDLILQAKNQRASEVLFVVGSEPKMKVYGEWRSLKNVPVTGSDWSILVQTVLNSQQIAQLETLGVANGETASGKGRMGFSFFLMGSVMRALLSFESEISAGSEVVLPPAVLESIVGTSGLHIVLGAKKSNLTGALTAISQKINDEKSCIALVLSSQPVPQVKEKKTTFIYHHIDGLRGLQNDELFRSADIILIHGLMDDKVLLEAVRLAEQGATVILTAMSSSIVSYLRRSFSVVQEGFGHQGVPRLADCLQSVSFHVAGKSLQDEWLSAFEYMLVKPHIRQYLGSEDIKSLDALLKGTAETTGVQTLNQSLVQLLVRRRFDLKTAFEISREPDLLDQQLKKLGV